jgi:glycosyltransferase involved in cell wall biosynthesis
LLIAVFSDSGGNVATQPQLVLDDREMQGLLTLWTQRMARPFQTIPTVDYYFMAALSSLVAGHGRPEPGRPIARLGPHTLAHRSRVVIFRYTTRSELARLRELGPERVYYLIDDMLPLARACRELPVDYRRRLVRFTRDLLPQILELNPTIIAPSDAILALFPDHAGERLDPALLAVASHHRHFASPGPFRLAFLGTRSHANGFDFLAPVLEQVLTNGQHITLTAFFGRYLPPRIARLPGVENHAPLPWADYRDRMAGERFHALLAPLPDTPFNRGRSLTKLMEAAATGAALLTSVRAPFNDAIETGRDGLLLGDDPAEWIREIQCLTADRDAARSLAEGGARLARRVGDPDRLALFWRERLGF